MQNLSHYRTLLKEEYSARKTKNPSYSLRAFARDLQVSSSHLRQLLNGSRSLSAKRAQILGEIMGWEPARIQLFVTNVIEEAVELPEGGEIQYHYRRMNRN